MEKKIELYNEFIEFMIDSMSVKGTALPKKLKALGIKLQTIGLKMVVISSDKVVEKFIEWRAITQGGSDPEGVFKAFAELLFEMRKEILFDHSMDATDRSIQDVLDILT